MEHIHALPEELKAKVEGGREYTKTEKDFFSEFWNSDGFAKICLGYSIN